MTLPEVGRQRQHTRVQQVAVFECLVVEIVLSGQAQCTRLDAHVDVLGHQHHIAARQGLAKAHHHTQNLIVGFALGQAGGQLDIEQGGLEIELAAGFAVASLGQGNAFLGVAQAVGGQHVEVATDLAHIA